ncbi:hypothetical protein [Nonomuraea mesophila]|uniref:hypothetical protein n=1 Tax=Nonomuraea mesophila TaxID=2530382 RepID=UPI0015F2CEDC|nr:hypothetical protein [Nonomuraea mesophila]
MTIGRRRGGRWSPPLWTPGDPAIAEISEAAGNGEHRLVNRYFEATPPPVLTAALDGFGKFITQPGSYKEVLETIQQAADEYWSTHQPG